MGRMINRDKVRGLAASLHARSRPTIRPQPTADIVWPEPDNGGQSLTDSYIVIGHWPLLECPCAEFVGARGSKILLESDTASY